MGKLFIRFIISFVFCFSSILPIYFTNTTNAQQKPIPSYAKWGRLALTKTQERYPNAQIIDYLHIGRRKGNQTSTERFKFWLKDRREFGVFVNIEFNNKTEKVINVTFKETPK
ncbi:YqzG/YhdC family protein [Neobacillus sp. LXY-1]|uniref:YqzG/YhdC family protein n=1 Tax=Neobacillus sp. LXY-1 TaxID=3379133 RepID=UPI003EE0D8DF